MTRDQFISNLSHWNSYLPILWEALQNTNGDVIELGVGDGSTDKLHQYCKANHRNLFSYESNLEWYRKFEPYSNGNHKVEYVGNNWDVFLENHRKQIGVLFSDEAPGYMRKFNISMYANLAQVVVAHDTEKESDHGYRFSFVESIFRYHKRFEYEGADASAFSNYINVSTWVI